MCARCTGVMLGYLFTIPIYLIHKGSYIQSIIFSSVMLFDWLIQYAKIRESTNIRRLITGFLGGYGVMLFQILTITNIINQIKEYF